MGSCDGQQNHSGTSATSSESDTKAGASSSGRASPPNFKPELLTVEENLVGLAAIYPELTNETDAVESARRLALDTDCTGISVSRWDENIATLERRRSHLRNIEGRPQGRQKQRT